ncbi:hypothetical protein CV018_02975, partial [Staphylococcus aureus]
NMVRTIKIENFTPIAGTKNGAVANVTLTTIAGGMTKSSNILLTVYWVILPPQGPEDIDRNPIGLYIPDFKVSGNTSGGCFFLREIIGCATQQKTPKASRSPWHQIPFFDLPAVR